MKIIESKYWREALKSCHAVEEGPPPAPNQGHSIETTPMRELIKEMPGTVFEYEWYRKLDHQFCKFFPVTPQLARINSPGGNKNQWLVLLVLFSA